MLAMRLHRERGRKSDGNKKSASPIHAHLGGPSTGPCVSHGENAPVWARLLDGYTQGCFQTLFKRTTWEVWKVSEVASFSSSLKG